MNFSILTLFPNFFASPLSESLLGRAQEKGKFSLSIHNLRDWSDLPHKQVDDTPYGGGAGMVLKPDILAAAVKALKKKDTFVILTDPGGVAFNQKLAEDLSKKSDLLLIAGRYEGVDQRFKDRYVDLEVSIGDYILNGGEAASLVILETVARLLPGVLGAEESLEFESFSHQKLNDKELLLLEYPQYTRPLEFEGQKVPEELLSGNHEKIKEWRLQQALERTRQKRPDLLK